MKLNIVRWLWLLLVCGSPAVTHAQFDFATNNGSITIMGYDGAGGVVSIPATINGLSVTSIGNQAFTNCGSLTSVTIPDSVTNIGSCAFTNCICLTNIIVPASVSYIGSKAFAFCTHLLSVYFLGNAPTIGGGILVPNSISAVVYETPGTTGWGTAFGGRPTALWVRVDYCTYTTDHGTLTITVYMSPNGAVSIPDTIAGLPVTGIGDYAFTNCANLTNIMIPASVTNIGYYPFMYCSNLTAISVNSLNPAFSSGVDGVLFNQDHTVLLAFPMGKGGDYSVPSSVTDIEGSAFYDCWNLSDATIPNTVTHIEALAFFNCYSLTNVMIGTGVTQIADYMFTACSNLTSVLIPTSVTNIGVSAFAECTSLANATIPDTLNSISSNLFYCCSSLSAVTIGNRVSSIGAGAFEYCGSLSKVALGTGLTNVGDSAFSYCTNLKAISIPDSVATIGNSAFGDCYSLASVRLGENTQTLDDYAFSGCLILTNVIFCTNLSTIGNHAFQNCGFSSIVIPNSVTNIGQFGFAYCYNLASISIPDLITNISDNMFYYCSNLTSVAIPNSVTGIGFEAFQGCGFTSFTIPTNVNSIGSYVFAQCFSLTNISIPSSISYLGMCAFAWCNLINVTIPAGVTYLGDAAFAYCYNLKTITFLGNAPSLWTYFGQDGLQFSGDANTIVYYLSGAAGFGPQFGGLATVELNTVGFAEDSNMGTSPLEVEFSTSAIDSGGNFVTNWNWDFGDGSTSVAQNPSHTYTEIGTFYPTLVATNNVGGTVIGYWPPINIYDVTALSDFLYVTNNGTIVITGYIGSNSVVIIPSAVNGLPVSGLIGGLFYNCASVTYVHIPDTITSIPFYEFWGCGKLSTVTLPKKVTSIGNDAFAYCPNLLSLTFPNTLTSIGDGAFGCSFRLGSLYFYGDAPSFGQYVLQGTISTTAYYLPGTRGWDVASSIISTNAWLLRHPVILNNEPNFGLESNNFGFAISWATNISLVIGACTNLSNPVWQPVQTNMLSNGTSYFSDAQWTNFPSRFYRISSP